MEQVNQLKQMREAAQQRMNTAREGIKQQLLALENSADAKLVKSLGTLIADLELLAAPAIQSSATTSIATPSVENVAENALADALGTPAPAAAPVTAKADSLSALTEQLRGTMATNS